MSADRRIGRRLLAAICLAAAVSAVHAQPRMGPGRHGDGEGPRRMFPPEQRADPETAEPGGRHGRGGRLSPEERRQLRRDVHQAGRDIYPERMRGMRRLEGPDR